MPDQGAKTGELGGLIVNRVVWRDKIPLINPRAMDYPITAHHEEIYDRIKALFPDLRLNRPGPLWLGTYHWGRRSDGASATDWIGPAKLLLLAFIKLEGWPGGLGLGLEKANLHLHVDFGGPRRYFIETLPNGAGQVYKGDARFAQLIARAKRAFGLTDAEIANYRPPGGFGATGWLLLAAGVTALYMLTDAKERSAENRLDRKSREEFRPSRKSDRAPR